MQAEQLVSTQLYPLKSGDKAGEALEFMASQGVAVLPVLEDGRLLGYVRSSDLLACKKTDRVGSLLTFRPFWPHLMAGQHLYEMVPIFQQSGFSVLAVLDAEGQYLGMVDVIHLQEHIANSLTYKGVGAIVSLEVNPRDFSPALIARLAEENNVKILGMVVEELQGGSYLVSLKLNSTSAGGFIASCQRFGLRITATHLSDEDAFRNSSAYDSIFKFIDF